MSARDLRDVAAQLLQAGVEAADGGACVARHLAREGHTLRLGPLRADLRRFGRVRLVGAGKAAVAMARAATGLVGDALADGLVIAPHGAPAGPEGVVVRHGGHPLPDEAGVAATRALLAAVADGRPDDLVLVVLSGGASALLTAPAPGLSLEDLRRTHALLLGCGAPISEVNTVRRHLSAVKGGRLAVHLHPAEVWCLVLSDVPGDAVGAVASGPTVPDPTTFADADAVLRRHALVDRLPPAARAHLASGLAGRIEDTPKPGDPRLARARTVVVGSVADAAAAAAHTATHLGFDAEVRELALHGEARDVGARLAEQALALAARARQPTCWLFGGETTVTLGEAPGHGGRNQEVALAAALGLDGHGGVAVFSAGTDGVDGPTDVAGAAVDGATAGRIRASGLDPARALARHDSHPALAAAGAHLGHGPTGTNVMDLLGILVSP